MLTVVSTASDPFDALFGGRAHRAVNPAAAVQAERGVRLRKSPGASSRKILGHGAKVTRHASATERQTRSATTSAETVMLVRAMTPSGMHALQRQLKGAKGSLAAQLIKFAHGQQDSLVVTGGSASAGSGAKLYVQLQYKTGERPN